MDEKTLRQIAKALVATTEKFYRPGDRCPMCGYDAYWDCDSAQESEEAACQRILEAIGITGEETDGTEHRDSSELVHPADGSDGEDR